MKNTIIVEVEGFEGEVGMIAVCNARAESGLGRDDRLFCVAEIDASGVARFIDWGYATLDEARAAWPATIAR
jgi:hypothetical protein